MDYGYYWRLTMRRINKKIWYIYNQLILKKLLGRLGNNSFIYKPLQIDNIKNINIDNDVYIAEGAWIYCGQSTKETLIIKEKTTIGHFAHIVALSDVEIEKEVMIADKVFISDCTHCYENIEVPICKQPIRFLKRVVIGEGSWLGENVSICGASVGKHCVIGANSVVTNDIPDYCVAVGSPARVVKMYDDRDKEWKHISMKTT